MPAPGSRRHITNVVENISSGGTISTYDFYTQVGVGPTGTVTGSISGMVVKTKSLSLLDNVQVVGFNEATGTVTGMQVAGFGKGLGSLVGSVIAGTIIADSNTVLLKAFKLGTVASGGELTPSEIAAGTVIAGTVALEEYGT